CRALSWRLFCLAGRYAVDSGPNKHCCGWWRRTCFSDLSASPFSCWSCLRNASQSVGSIRRLWRSCRGAPGNYCQHGIGARSPWAIPAVWIFNVGAAVDLLCAFCQGARVDLRPGSLGAGFYIVTALVPPLLVSPALIFLLLLRGHAKCGPDSNFPLWHRRR